jgi:hypothetical protein
MTVSNPFPYAVRHKSYTAFEKMVHDADRVLWTV